MTDKTKEKVKKNKFKRIKTSVITVILVGVTAISTTLPIKQDYFEMSKQLEIMTSVFRELNIYYVDPLSPGELVHTGIDSMLESLDPYTRYYPEEKIEDVRFISTGEYGGIGISMMESGDGKLIVSDIKENSPAEESTLELGDEIISVDGISVSELGTKFVGDKIKGTSGTTVNLGIRSAADGTENTIILIREKIKSPDIPYHGMLDENTGYLILSKFTKTASTEVRKALVNLTDSMGATQIVFDLRGNGGGLLRESINIVNFFVPKGTNVVDMKGKTEAWNKSYAALRNPLLLDTPLIIIIDERSASASEIVAGALQELDRAVVVGMESFGKGLVQQTKDLAYGSRMKITVAKYYTPSGRCVQRLQYDDRDESGNATVSADSTLQVFYTRNGRPVLEGRGVIPDVEVEPRSFNYILEGLIANDVFFNFAVSKRDIKIDAPSEFACSYELWNDFVKFVLAQDDIVYSSMSNDIVSALELSLEDENLLDDNKEAYENLAALLKPDLEKDLANNKELIIRALEEELIFHKVNTSGLYEFQLPKDPNISTALDLLNTEEYKNILVEPAQ